MITQIVQLSAKQGGGKSTIAQKIVETLNAKKTSIGVEVRFAKIIYDIHDYALETLRGLNIPVPDKDGNLLQLLGTDWARKNYGDNIWVDALKGTINRFEKSYSSLHPKDFQLVIVISDCRFKNEFDGFPEALRVRLMCDEAVRKGRTHAWREAVNHPSEIDLDGYSAAGKFDLYLDTQNLAIEGCVSLILAQLDKNTWMEKRKT